MKQTVLILLMAASVVAASAQTPAPPATAATKPAVTAAKPAAPAAKPATTAAKPATATAKPATAGAKPAVTAAKPGAAAATAAKLPLGVPAPGIPAVKTIKKTLLTVALHYQELKIGAGAVAEPNKMYKVFYTGYRDRKSTR